MSALHGKVAIVTGASNGIGRAIAEVAAENPTFIGTKDTGLDVPGLKAVLQAVPDLAVFGGEDF